MPQTAAPAVDFSADADLISFLNGIPDGRGNCRSSRDLEAFARRHREVLNGAPVFAFLRPVLMNLLRRGGYRSIRRGLRELAYDIRGMLALGGVQLAGERLE